MTIPAGVFRALAISGGVLALAATVAIVLSSSSMRTIGVLDQWRQDVTACNRLHPANFATPADWIVAMRANGGDWSRLADSAVMLRAPNQRPVLIAAYAMHCDRALLPPWMRFVYYLDIFSPLAVIVGIFAAIVAWWNYRHTSASSRFANAVVLYRRYLELCVTHPNLAEPRATEQFTTEGNEGFRQYELFLFVLFRACEELLEHNDARWKQTVRDQLHYHLKYLRESTWLNNWNEWLGDKGKSIYSPALQAAMDEVIERANRAERAKGA